MKNIPPIAREDYQFPEDKLVVISVSIFIERPDREQTDYDGYESDTHTFTLNESSIMQAIGIVYPMIASSLNKLKVTESKKEGSNE